MEPSFARYAARAWAGSVNETKARPFEALVACRAGCEPGENHNKVHSKMVLVIFRNSFFDIVKRQRGMINNDDKNDGGKYCESEIRIMLLARF